MRKLFGEPLVHFLLLGAFLFGAWDLMNPGSAAPDTRRIEITPGKVQALRDAFTRQWRRPPDDAELNGLVEDYIREEILYREALAMGLEQDDTIIRRRLAQKMEFLSEDLAMQAEPSEAELRNFYAERAADFAEPERLSFSHVYFNPDLRGPAVAADAELVLDEMRAARVTEDTDDRGDRFLMQSRYERLTISDTAQLFGEAFAREVFSMPEGSWEGPVESGFGWHLVRVSSREASHQPGFEAVRDEVRREFDYERQRSARAATYEALRSRYEIVMIEAGEQAS